MAVSEANVSVYHCDSGDCDRTALSQNGLPGTWVTGTVRTGDTDSEWLACAPKHVRSAVLGVLSEHAPAVPAPQPAPQAEAV